MLDKLEAEKIINKYVELRDEYKKTNIKTKDLIDQKNICISKFEYIIRSRISKYKSFSNYEDLKQEGMIGLLYDLENFDTSKKAPFFYWEHKYIDTRVSRAANSHSTIKYPLKIAKENIPHKEAIIPTIIDEKTNPELNTLFMEANIKISKALQECLSENERKVISMYYGIETKKININKISIETGLDKDTCKKYFRTGLAKLKAKFNRITNDK